MRGDLHAWAQSENVASPSLQRLLHAAARGRVRASGTGRGRRQGTEGATCRWLFRCLRAGKAPEVPYLDLQVRLPPARGGVVVNFSSPILRAYWKAKQSFERGRPVLVAVGGFWVLALVAVVTVIAY